MFAKDNFIHTEYAKKTGFIGRIALRKEDIRRYEEHEDGSVEIFGLNNINAIISMSYDEVRKELTETVS